MDTTTYTEEQPTSERKKRNLIVAGVALFPIVLSIIVFLLIIFIGDIKFPKKITSKTELVEIILPIHKSIIPKKFSISGTIKDMPADSFIYLVESRDKHFWPKLFIGNKAKTWKKQLTAHGKKNQFFSFLLVKVDKEGKRKFDGWFKKSRETGQYLGLKHINFAEPVARIRVKTK